MSKLNRRRWLETLGTVVKGGARVADDRGGLVRADSQRAGAGRDQQGAPAQSLAAHRADRRRCLGWYRVTGIEFLRAESSKDFYSR